MNATRSKRWDGNVHALPSDYLNQVMEKMQSYGDRVQFSLLSSGALPSYQVINPADKKMSFDKNHHLLNLQGEEFAGSNGSMIFTLEQIRNIASGVARDAAARPRTARVVRAPGGATRSTAAKLDDQFAAQRYEYFRTHRNTLPPAIAEHSAEITQLMKAGKSVEDAFDEVLKKYF